MAYKTLKNTYSDNSASQSQDDVSAGFAYSTGAWQYKLGYSKNFNAKINGVDNTKAKNGSATAVQALYNVGANVVTYARFVKESSDDNSGANKILLGMEYGF